MATPCGCDDGDYRQECWPNSEGECGGTNVGGPPGDCPSGQRRDASGNCVPEDRSNAANIFDCPPGQTYVGRHGRCLPDCQGAQTRDSAGNCVGDVNYGGSSSGGAPTPAPIGSRGSSSSGPALAYSPMANDFNSLLDKMLREGLASPSRFTPQALQAMYGQITKQTSGRIRRGEAAVRADAARRNMSRSGAVGAALRGVRDAAESDRGSAVVQVQMAKINADHQDRNAALDRAQRYLDSLRDSEYRLMISGEQRRQFDANLALSYANLAQQRTMLEMTLQSDWDKLRALMGFTLLGQGF